jgi:hypothetical protein
MSGANFYERMNGLGYKSHRQADGRYIQGIAFKTEPTWAELSGRFG